MSTSWSKTTWVHWNASIHKYVESNPTRSTTNTWFSTSSWVWLILDRSAHEVVTRQLKLLSKCLVGLIHISLEYPAYLERCDILQLIADYPFLAPLEDRSIVFECLFVRMEWRWWSTRCRKDPYWSLLLKDWTSLCGRNGFRGVHRQTKEEHRRDWAWNGQIMSEYFERS